MAALITSEQLQRRVFAATVEAAAECRQAALERARLRTLQRLESEEPSCSCTQTDVDLFDARGCEYHDPESEWNVALRAVTMIEQYESYAGAESADCPF